MCLCYICSVGEVSSVFVLQMQRWGSVDCVCVTDAALGKCRVCLCYRCSVGEVLIVFVLQMQHWGSVECVCVTDAAVGKC